LPSISVSCCAFCAMAPRKSPSCRQAGCMNEVRVVCSQKTSASREGACVTMRKPHAPPHLMPRRQAGCTVSMACGRASGYVWAPFDGTQQRCVGAIPWHLGSHPAAGRRASRLPSRHGAQFDAACDTPSCRLCTHTDRLLIAIKPTRKQCDMRCVHPAQRTLSLAAQTVLPLTHRVTLLGCCCSCWCICCSLS
jgi:hypothetical protein